MRAYNEQWIFGRELLRQAERWHRRGLLTDEQIAAVQRTYPTGFRQTNGILEIGLFLFTTLAVMGAFLLVATFMSMLVDERVSFGILCLLFGVGLGLLGQQSIHRRLLYRNGVDNAFAVLTTGFITFGLLLFLPENLTLASYCIAALPFLLVALWYYGDTILAFVTLATLYTALVDGLLEFTWGKDALPFVLMTVSALLYVGIRRVKLPPVQQVYYADPLNLTESLSLVILAASGNYFVVREVNALLLTPIADESPEITLPALFWLLTFLIPGAYLGRGFSTRNRILLSLGGLGLIAAVATVHEYAALVPLNVALTIGGGLLIGISVLLIRYLARPKHGFTDAPDEDLPDQFFVNAETIAAIQATAGAQHSPEKGVRFGGGNFGGGGGEGRY